MWQASMAHGVKLVSFASVDKCTWYSKHARTMVACQVVLVHCGMTTVASSVVSTGRRRIESKCRTGGTRNPLGSTGSEGSGPIRVACADYGHAYVYGPYSWLRREKCRKASWESYAKSRILEGRVDLCHATEITSLIAALVLKSAHETLAVIRRNRTHLVRLEMWSAITKMKRLPFLEARMGSKMSTDSSVRGSVAGNSVRGVVCRRKARRLLSTNCALGEGGVNVRYYRRPIICLSHSVIYSVQTGMGCHDYVVLEGQDAFASRLWYDELAVVRRLALQSVKLAAEEGLCHSTFLASGHLDTVLLIPRFFPHPPRLGLPSKTGHPLA